MNAELEIRAKKSKLEELEKFLNGYWGRDIWDISDNIFDNIRSPKLTRKVKIINFSAFSTGISHELKYFFSSSIMKKSISFNLFLHYSCYFKQFSNFLKQYYLCIDTILSVPFSKLKIQWRTYLIGKGKRLKPDGSLSNKHYECFVSQFYNFIFNYYDIREEFEKDIWDCRNIPGARITPVSTQYYLDFNNIPIAFRELAKKYIRVRLSKLSISQCYTDIMALKLLFGFVHNKYPMWNSLINITRNDMEEFIIWFTSHTSGWEKCHLTYFVNIHTFLTYIQRAEYSEAPDKPVACLIFENDFPRLRSKPREDIKYIPEEVIFQLESNIESIKPVEYIPIVILLRASGWRISDILNLRYNNCLDRTSQGWYLCGDILKTDVLGHRIPITDDVAAIVEAVVESTREKSTYENNPYNLLFVRFEGKRMGKPPTRDVISKALNRLAFEKNICDNQGNVFKFGNHAFRHTKGVELINNGMNILHVQKWMAHASPEMTLRYAKILDTTMRKSWEEVAKKGLFRISESGKPIRIDISDIENEDIIEWEYIRHNLDAVRMPLGYCMKPKKQECHTQLNPCLTCRNLCTTTDFIPQYELEIQETKAVIERGKSQNRNVWIEKNQALLERYESILSVLKGGKTHHKAGKKGREYIGEERNNG
ncbi:MAG: tyrosine-type recombinase/integrase [Clostridia bacterium]